MYECEFMELRGVSLCVPIITGLYEIKKLTLTLTHIFFFHVKYTAV